MKSNIFRNTLLLGALACLTSLQVFSQSQNTVPTAKIVVSGAAEMSVKPDRIFLQIAVESRNDDARAAHKKVTEDVTKALEFLRKRKDVSELKTTSVRLHPQIQDYKNQAVTYSARESLSFILTDMNAYDEVILQLIDMGINGIQQVSFQSSRTKEYEQMLMKQAVRNAREKAVLLAGELGQEVGKAILISESYSGGPVPYAMSFKMADEASSVEAGELTLSTTIQIEFELK